MSLRRVAYVLGAVVAATGVAMLPSAGVSLIYQEWGQAGAIALAGVTTIAVGAYLWRLWGARGELTMREGFAAVGLSWFAMTFAGTLPFIFSGTFDGITNSFFETAAGFSTTGSSVLADPGVLSHGMLFWRSSTQWIGGMGIIILSIAILPLLGVGGIQLARAEAPGPSPDRLTPRFRETARRLWFVYVGLTAVEVAFLWLGDMNLFQAVAHSMTTMSTGGFSTEATSLAGFSTYTQWVVVVFMILAGTSFALHFRALRRPLEYARHPEAKLYGSILVVAAAVIVIGTWGGAVEQTIREAVFTAASLVTTTGFATTDFGIWPGALQILVVGLMFVGGMAGSTAGSVKVYRHAVLVRASRADLRRVIHPRGVFVTHFGDEEVSDDVVESVQNFFLLYMFLFMTGVLVFGIIESSVGAGLDLVTSASAVASALGNIGPGLGQVGPSSNYLEVPGLGKWLLSILMITGRLEIFPVILLLTREMWRR